MSVPKADAVYREELIEAGVRPELVSTLSGHQLDCIGNLVDVYRTTMQEQNPARFSIVRFASVHRALTGQTLSHRELRLAAGFIIVWFAMDLAQFIDWIWSKL